MVSVRFPDLNKKKKKTFLLDHLLKSLFLSFEFFFFFLLRQIQSHNTTSFCCAGQGEGKEGTSHGEKRKNKTERGVKGGIEERERQERKRTF